MSEVKLQNWTQHPCILEVGSGPWVPTTTSRSSRWLSFSSWEDKVEKLIPNLRDKKKIRDHIHHKALKQYQRLGLKIIKIHRGTKFWESSFIKQYIDLTSLCFELSRLLISNLHLEEWLVDNNMLSKIWVEMFTNNISFTPI